jgi:hypothetical protein
VKNVEPQLIVDVTLYPTVQGGRAGSTPAGWFGCPCKVNKDDVAGWDCRILLDGNAMTPGETRRVGMMFLSGEETAARFRAAGTFYLWELRIVGEARVVLN